MSRKDKVAPKSVEKDEAMEQANNQTGAQQAQKKIADLTDDELLQRIMQVSSMMGTVMLEVRALDRRLQNRNQIAGQLELQNQELTNEALARGIEDKLLRVELK